MRGKAAPARLARQLVCLRNVRLTAGRIAAGLPAYRAAEAPQAFFASAAGFMPVQRGARVCTTPNRSMTRATV